MIIHEDPVNSPVFTSRAVHRLETGKAGSGSPGRHGQGRSASPPGKRRSTGPVRGRLEIHALSGLAHCHGFGDRGVYYGDELVGSIIRTGGHWSVWRIMDCSRPMDRADLAMYEEYMEHMADFRTLHEARRYVRGPFREIILRECGSQGS